MTRDADKKPRPTDPTPSIGAETDIAPLGQAKSKPPHEQTADEDVDVVDWEKVAAMQEFQALVAAKLKFILPATIFFLVYYFALPVLVGYAPEWMKQELIGKINLAYLFALSQFIMAWTLAALYMRAAGRFDHMVREIIKKVSTHRKRK
ncbi:MAG: DUF485 domain-containing protein [Nitrospira sp.]|nr:DUF485 domain-containing protein [Nitrospira sp.]